jgi:hypothetical protein
MADPRCTEREEQVEDRTGLDRAVDLFVANATAAAAEIHPRDRLVLLMLFAEAHQRAATAIKALAEKDAAHPRKETDG